MDQRITYYLDGVNFTDYGVYVSQSSGIINKPKLKPLTKRSWDDYHGEVVDLEHKFYEPREILLTCFIKASTKLEFITNATAFEQQFMKPGTNRLQINASEKPLIFEVYCPESIEIVKEWQSATQVGTFKIKLIEPEPMKKILKFHWSSIDQIKCKIDASTKNKVITIYWGDGAVDDIKGTRKIVQHEYPADGDYYIVVAGDLDNLPVLNTNAEVIWNKI